MSASPLAPATVVQDYYDAINAHNYRAAWNLGGDHLSANYNAFVNGFAGTASDTVKVTSVEGGTVSVEISATQTNGSVAYYHGTYTVQNGVITGADVQGGLGSPQGGSTGDFCVLNLTESLGQGATGHYTQTFIYTNIGIVDCEMDGYPSLQFYLPQGGLFSQVVHHGSGFFTEFNVPPTSFTLAPGQTASFDIGGADFNAQAQTACPAASQMVTIPPVSPANANDDTVQMQLNPTVPLCPPETDESPLVPGSTGPAGSP